MFANHMIVTPPKLEDREFKKPLLCGPGPSDIHASVYEAMQKPVLSPVCDELFNVSIFTLHIYRIY